MNIETKEVYFNAMAGDAAKDEYEMFGWKYTQDARHGRTTYRILARDMDMPNYQLIKALDDKYFALRAKKKHYEKMSFGTFLLLLLIFVVPGLLYWLFKYIQKNNYKDHNDKIQAQMNECVKEVKTLIPQQQ